VQVAGLLAAATTLTRLQNWDLCRAIINTLVPSTAQQSPARHLTVLTNPSQSLSLPPHVSTDAVQHRKSDFSPESLQLAFAGQDLVISTMAGGDSEQQNRIIDAAVAAGVKRFIPHEFGHDTMNRAIRRRIVKYAGRAKVVDHLQQVSKSNPDFEWAAAATGCTLDTTLISGDLGFDFEWQSATIHGIGTELFPASSLQRVGQVVASMIQHWSAVRNQYIYAAGVLTSANEILRSAEKAMRREWTVGNYDVEECIREGETRIQRGYPDSGMFLLERSVLYDEVLRAEEPFQTRSANGILQLAPESVETIVAQAYYDLQHHGKPGCGCSS
jgi:hypothetical protein